MDRESQGSSLTSDTLQSVEQSSVIDPGPIPELTLKILKA